MQNTFSNPNSTAQNSGATNSTCFIYIVLGMLTAFAPFVTDMYLPALPGLTVDFSATASQVQMGLTSSMIGLALGQLVIGPLSDKFGRKPPLILSLIAFIIASACCIFASNIWIFIAMRLFQGIGASGGIVLARSIATDLYAGKRLAKVMAIIGAINGIAPVLSPVLGGVVLSFTSWQGIFVILLAIGCALVIASFILRESYPAENRRQLSILQTFAQSKDLFLNRKFRIYTLIQATCMGTFFAQIAAAPFIFQTHYGFSQIGFSLFFACNALTLGIFAFLSATKFKTPETAIRAGSTVLLITATLAACALYFNAPVYLFEATLWFMHVGFGLMFSPLTVLAMNSARRQAGMGSAIFGAVGFVTGGILSPIVGLGNMLISTGITFILCAVVTWILSYHATKPQCLSDAQNPNSNLNSALSSAVMNTVEDNA